MALLDLNKKAAKDLPIQPRKDDKGNWLHNGLSPVQLTAVEVTERITDYLLYNLQQLRLPNKPIKKVNLLV